MEERRPLRRQPDDHHFCSLIMLAVTAGGLLLVTWIATKAVLFFLQEAPILSQPIGKGMSLHRAAKLGMFDDAARVLEEIAPYVVPA